MRLKLPQCPSPFYFQTGNPGRDIEVSESNPNDNIIMMHNSLIVKFISFIIEITFIMHLIAEVNRLVKSNLVSLEVFFIYD